MARFEKIDPAILAAILEASFIQSPIYRWLDVRYDEICRLSEGGRISWEPVVEYLTSKSILDGHGKLPTARRLAGTWFAVKKARSRQLRLSERQERGRERETG